MIPQSILDFFHASKSLPFRSMTFFNFLLEATLAGSVLILVMLVLRLVFRKRIGSRLVYLAWILVAVRLLVPVAIPNPLMDSLRPTLSHDTGARPVADQVRVRYQDTMDQIAYRLSVAAYESGSPLQQNLSDFTHELETYTSYGWLGKAYLLMYAMGSLLVAAIFTGRHIRFRRKIRRNIIGPLEGAQLDVYLQTCAHFHVKAIPAMYADPLPSPCLVGVFKPMIVLPLTLPKEGYCEALLHELNHYRTRDTWWALLRCVCCVVHWFNPLVWIAQRLVKIDCELACDEKVAIQLTPEERLHYANTLVCTAMQAYAPAAGVLATGMTMTGKRLKQRINAILHLKAVQRVAAVLVAIVLVLFTVAAFSTAESSQQTQQMTTDTSAYPFSSDDSYPEPDVALGQPVSPVQLSDVQAATAQAKQYLCALYPEDQAMIETTYAYQVRLFGQSSWEIIVTSPENADETLYYMELKGTGELVSLNRLDIFANGDNENNYSAKLPHNMSSVVLAYGQRVSSVALQGMTLNKALLSDDIENEQGRCLTYTLSNAADEAQQILLSVQIAPTFRLINIESIFNNNLEHTDSTIVPATQKLTYSKDAALSFDAVFWGNSDSDYTLPSDTTLTLQQAFDLAVETMLGRAGLANSDFLQLTLKYGYYDKAHFDGDTSVWRFVWYVNGQDATERYWVDFYDMLVPEYINFSAPGQGLG